MNSLIYKKIVSAKVRLKELDFNFKISGISCLSMTNLKEKLALKPCKIISVLKATSTKI